MNGIITILSLDSSLPLGLFDESFIADREEIESKNLLESPEHLCNSSIAHFKSPENICSNRMHRTINDIPGQSRPLHHSFSPSKHDVLCGKGKQFHK